MNLGERLRFLRGLGGAPGTVLPAAPRPANPPGERWGSGRELFASMRTAVGSAEDGAMTFALEEFDG